MSRILTPLEEADHILMAKAGRDREVNNTIPDEFHLDGTLRVAKCDKLIMTSVISNGEVHKKSEHDFPDPLPYVWSM